MSSIRFTWDPAKAELNSRKHAVSFEEASTVFADELGRLMYDPDHSNDEDRYLILGMSTSLRILVVCHVYREDAGLIRIISARKATSLERKQYEDLP
ncbi:MAG TPA: BrnT family toxin [Candidatus Sumerlaeota bacterium]|nr:BrnT family toxin [Candidatus Sumerlaeota bacterium]HPK02530.1 BrnT family toxin [Candidatus Sumerlaeota bacterium]